MDQNKLSFIGHSTHHFLSPVSVGMVDRVLDVADPAAGAVVFDLGCGPGAMALHMAQTHGVAVQAVDRSALMIEEGERRAAERTAALAASGGSVTFHRERSIDFLARAGEADLVAAVGALQLTGGDQNPTAVLSGLSRNVKPGGYLLWGETHWRREPSDGMRLLLGPTASVYGSHADYVRAGEAAGLLPQYAVTSSEQEWDEYTWRYSTAIDTYLRAHPNDPEAAEMRNRAQGWRALYLHEGRETMGFGLYLFRKG